MQVPPHREHFHTLDFLRATAAVCVLLLHWFNGVGLPWFGNGGLSVDFFFLLSGFVIAYSYESRLLSTMSNKRFLWIRFVRLYPMILAAVALGLVRQILHNHFVQNSASALDYLEVAVAGLLMIPLLTITPLTPGYETHRRVEAGWAYPLDMVLWSLFYEGAASILYGLIVKKLTTRKLVMIAVAGWIGLVASQWIVLDQNSLPIVFATASFRVIYSFFLGVLVFRLRSQNRLSNASAGPVVLSIIMIAIALYPRQSPWFALSMATFIFPLVVLLGANHQTTRFVRTSQLLGDLSYPLYVLQIPLMWMITGALKSMHLYDRLPLVPLGLFIAATICALSWIALKFYDIPARKWLAQRNPQ